MSTLVAPPARRARRARTPLPGHLGGPALGASTRKRCPTWPDADRVVLDGVGHCPQLDVPLETAELILGFTR